MSAAVLTRPVPDVVPSYDPCAGTGGVFRSRRSPEACPFGCPPRIVQAGGCLSCGCAPSACSLGCGCDCGCCPEPYRLPA